MCARGRGKKFLVKTSCYSLGLKDEGGLMPSCWCKDYVLEGKLDREIDVIDGNPVQQPKWHTFLKRISKSHISVVCDLVSTIINAISSLKTWFSTSSCPHQNHHYVESNIWERCIRLILEVVVTAVDIVIVAAVEIKVVAIIMTIVAKSVATLEISI